MHGHVALLVGRKASGQPVLEQIPAEHVGDAKHRLLGTPGLVLGCAEGDVVTVADDGNFEVIARGGNLSVLVYGEHLADFLAELRRTFAAIGGTVEAPDDLAFVVATVPVAAGFSTVERAVGEALDGAPGAQWFYGNVYDELDQPLNWWAAEPRT